MEDHNAINRTRMLLENRGLWDGDKEMALQTKARAEVLNALGKAENLKKPATSQLFSDVYSEPTKPLLEQERVLFFSFSFFLCTSNLLLPSFLLTRFLNTHTHTHTQFLFVVLFVGSLFSVFPTHLLCC